MLLVIFSMFSSSSAQLKNSDSKTFFGIPVNGVLSIWRKHLPTVNATVRAPARASWWCSQAAKPHFGKIVPTYKVIYRLYFAPNVDAKSITEMPRKLPFMWCYFMVETLAQNEEISLQTGLSD